MYTEDQVAAMIEKVKKEEIENARKKVSCMCVHVLYVFLFFVVVVMLVYNIAYRVICIFEIHSYVQD